MARLKLENIAKCFGETEVLKNISLDVADGEFLSLVGQSGCGKSTLLRIISGLEQPSAGRVWLDDAEVTHLPPKQRGVAMVFQDYALYPHMSVAENIMMPLIMARLPLVARLPLLRRVMPAARRARPEMAAQVETVAKQLRIDHLLSRRPAQLSGGQRQRVALGRALVRNPSLFLMDEPLSNLDAKLRVQVRREISELHAASGLTFVYVTHDQTEAMTMSDRVALLQGGKLLQVGSPGTLYNEPANLDVARFIGSPEINVLSLSPATSQDGGGGYYLGDSRVPLAFAQHHAQVQVGVRPDAIALAGLPHLVCPDLSSSAFELPFTATALEDLGPEVLIYGHFTGQPEATLRIRAQKGMSYQPPQGSLAALSLRACLDPHRMVFFSANGQRLNEAPRRVASVPPVAAMESAL